MTSVSKTENAGSSPATGAIFRGASHGIQRAPDRLCGRQQAQAPQAPHHRARPVSDRPPTTYQDIWDDYANGRLSTSVLRALLETDEVFAAWCKRKVDELRRARSNTLKHEQDEDMA